MSRNFNGVAMNYREEESQKYVYMLSTYLLDLTVMIAYEEIKDSNVLRLLFLCIVYVY